MAYIEEQIAYVEENITIKKRIGKGASFEEDLVKEWKLYLPGGSKRHIWVKHSYSLQH